MTRIPDALGVMVSGRADERTDERIQVLRTHAEPLERLSAPVAEHGQVLESLLSGQAILQEDRRR
ncbi:hypothetical protein [Kitasatospora sp. NPDC001683]